MANESADFTLPSTKSFAVSMGGEVETQDKSKVEFDSDNLPEEDEEKDAPDADEDSETPDAADEEGDAGEDEDDGEEPGDLGDFDAEDPEVVSKFDAKYMKDGSLDLEGSLTAEYWARREAGEEGLPDPVYEYLASKGISKGTVKQVEAMAETQRDAQKNSVIQQDGKLFEVAGGADKLQAALEWGKKGGYSKEQQERFNKATKGNDLEAKLEAVETLMARYNRANPPQKPKVPQRDATKGQGSNKGQGPKPFKDRAEMKAVRNSIKEGDQKAWADYNRRRAVSKFD